MPRNSSPNADFNELEKALFKGAAQLGIDLTHTQSENLMNYLRLLDKWNRAYNLTSIRQIDDMLPLHVLDSLVVHSQVQGVSRLIDVGTGPGLPGMILAIMNPDLPITLLDSNGKKTRFLFQVRTALKLDNVTIVNDRVEAYQPPELFDMIVSRAFASLHDMTRWCRHLLASDGCFLAMKGQYPEAELDAISADYRLLQAESVQIPGVEGERHLLSIAPTL